MIIPSDYAFAMLFPIISPVTEVLYTGARIIFGDIPSWLWR